MAVLRVLFMFIIAKKLVCKLHNYIKFTESLMYKGFRVIFDLHKNYILTT